MIHIRKEGSYLKTGLNITFGRVGWKPWVQFIWAKYSIQHHRLTYSRLRVRTHKWPMVIKESSEVDVIGNFLGNHDLIAVPRELMEDHAPKLINYARYFYQQFEAGVITRYYG